MKVNVKEYQEKMNSLIQSIKHLLKEGGYNCCDEMLDGLRVRFR